MTAATTHVIFGRVPMPERLELHDIVSDGPNRAFDRLGHGAISAPARTGWSDPCSARMAISRAKRNGNR